MTRPCLAALFLLLCLATARAQTTEEKKATVAYLQKLQQEGGFLPGVKTCTRGGGGRRDGGPFGRRDAGGSVGGDE